jgi:hypothetical protein
MTIVTWLLAGGLTGWTASYYLGQMHSQAIAFNVAVAAAGAGATEGITLSTSHWEART